MDKNLHVVMLPWSAFGHLIPFFHLSIALAKSKVHVSFISTPRNIQRLPQIPHQLSPFIHLIAIPLPDSGHLLPDSAESTADIPADKIQYLKRAVDLLRQPIKDFLAGISPDWVIVDFHVYWAGEIRHEFQTPVIMFSIFSSLAFLYLGPPELLSKDSEIMTRVSPASMTAPPEWVDFPTKVAYNLHEATIMYSALTETNASGISDGERVRRVLGSCTAVALRSCEEIEGEYLKLLQRLMLPVKIIPVGFLPPEKAPESGHEIVKWLDEQRVGSVVYVAFGSECELKREQVHEVAVGLQLSELPFLWALRKPSWADEQDDETLLPSGFLERTSKRGIVSVEWMPQLEILGHPAIGVSLIHSGWGSTIESLQAGVCLVVLPFIIDQPLIAKLLVEKGIGIEIRRNEANGWFGREDIAKALKEAMKSQEEGGQLKSAVTEAAAIVADEKLQWEHYFAGFLQFLRDKP